MKIEFAFLKANFIPYFYETGLAIKTEKNFGRTSQFSYNKLKGKLTVRLAQTFKEQQNWGCFGLDG